ncbi:hypothetical protein BCU94_06885 [Shewanella sp. 10N.286.52.C2]|uniref:hypothetical protein n=1 Tax=Shewanella sp. 10N.286.52.C2 TaxID=1880838 RepID=UPI000C81CB90|nr:hypothetical protein [Shewanella sp. 10N.286.52.C2]PMG31893.1 hypothetical protein BCU94_06885 [Shewanella sp. 10N.286.52.C2]
MGKKQFGFAFFLSLYVQLLEQVKPATDWPVIPEFCNAVSPAAAAFFAHLTVLLLVLLQLPSETELRTKVQIWKKRRKINKKLKDPTVGESVKDNLRTQLDELHLDELKNYNITVTPVLAEEKVVENNEQDKTSV